MAAAAAAVEPINRTNFEKTIDLSRYLKGDPTDDNKIVIKFNKLDKSITNIFEKATLQNETLKNKIKTYLEENNNQNRDIIKQRLLSSFQITFLEKILLEFGLTDDVCKYLKIVSDTKGQPNFENKIGKTKEKILNLQNLQEHSNDKTEFGDLHFIDNNTLKSLKDARNIIETCIDNNKILIGYLSLYRTDMAKKMDVGCNHVNSIIIDFKNNYIIVFEPKGNSLTPHIKRISEKQIKHLLKNKLDDKLDDKYTKTIDKLKYFSTRSEGFSGILPTKCPQGSCFDTDCQTYSLYGNLLYLINRNSIKNEKDLINLFSTKYMNTDYVNLLLMVVLNVACNDDFLLKSIVGLQNICVPSTGQIIPDNINIGFSSNSNNNNNNNNNNSNNSNNSKSKGKGKGKGSKKSKKVKGKGSKKSKKMNQS